MKIYTPKGLPGTSGEMAVRFMALEQEQEETKLQLMALEQTKPVPLSPA